MPESTDSSINSTPDGEEHFGQMLLTELRAHSQSDREVFELFQQELRRIARSKMRFERSDHTLQPTALISEAYLKLFKSSRPADFSSNPARTLRIIARAMEQILNDSADAHHAAKRGGYAKQRVPLDEFQALDLAGDRSRRHVDSKLVAEPRNLEEIFSIRQALTILRQASPRQAEVVQLQFYGGLTQEETAAVLGVSLETVKLDWRKARAFLKVQLAKTEQS